jgi:hypothetical protein
MILIAAPSLLTQAENAFVTSHDVTIVPFGDAVEVAQSARATSATIATSGMLGLLSPTPTMTDAVPSLSSHRRRIFVSVFDALVQVGYHQERNVSLINVTKVFFIRA